MRVTRFFWALTTLASSVSCGDHYEGGGRRHEIPTESSSGRPNVAPGDGSSTQGGSAGTSFVAEGGEAGSGGFFPLAGTSAGGGP